MQEPENPPQADWGWEPLAQSLVLPGGKHRPGLSPSAEGPPFRKVGQAEGAPFIGEERQQDQGWDGRSTCGGLSTGSELMTFVASTGQVDRNGNILDIQGWELDHYRANPVILFNHNWDLPPVGKTLKVGTEGDRLMVTIQFAPTSLGRELAILNANRYMGAASVGVRMLEWEIRRHPEHGYPIGFHSHRHELLEISVVPVPANPDTLQAGIELGRNAALGPSAAPILSGSAHLVGLPAAGGPSPEPASGGLAARFLRALNFGLRGDQ